MQVEELTVKNVKCNGCVANIRKGLAELAGVAEVAVTVEGGRVTVTGEGLDRAAISAKLAALGYPEA